MLKHIVTTSIRFRIIGIIAMCVLGIWGFWAKYRSDVASFKKMYQQEKQTQITTTIHKLEERLRFVYQTIRTMSFAPGVRKIDRYGKQFDEDARATVQQLFNNAYLNIKLSEVFL